MVRYKFTPGWNPCKPHAEDAPRISKYHAKVFEMTRHYAKPFKIPRQKPKTKVLKITKYHAIRQGFRCATQLRGKVLLGTPSPSSDSTLTFSFPDHRWRLTAGSPQTTALIIT